MNILEVAEEERPIDMELYDYLTFIKQLQFGEVKAQAPISTRLYATAREHGHWEMNSGTWTFYPTCKHYEADERT